MAERSLAGVPVLVTGADGFIGSHLVERLVADGSPRPGVLPLQLARLRRLARREPARRSRGDRRPARGHPRRAARRARDRRRRGRLPPRRADRDPVLVHRGRVVHRYERPRHDARAGGRPAGRRPADRPDLDERGLRHAQELPIRETHPLNAQSPYAASKVAADQLALAYHRSFELPVVVLRPFNTFGPRQSERAVLPTMLRQLLAGRSEIRLGGSTRGGT
jgi:nucleoside-diphosphate-sugar epimerase